ncbi:MAG: hypothetical protein AABY22_15985 [Nanoarchaeota archaeon]
MTKILLKCLVCKKLAVTSTEKYSYKTFIHHDGQRCSYPMKDHEPVQNPIKNIKSNDKKFCVDCNKLTLQLINGVGSSCAVCHGWKIK